MFALTMILLATVMNAPEQEMNQPVPMNQVIASDLIEEEEEEVVIEKEEIDEIEKK